MALILCRERPLPPDLAESAVRRAMSLTSSAMECLTRSEANGAWSSRTAWR